MNTPELIQLLAELGLKHYREHIHPDPYAATAAHTIAAEAAAKFSPESADAAAFVAVSTLVDLSNYSAQQAASVTQTNDAMKHYHATDAALLDMRKLVPEFNTLVEQLDDLSFSDDARGAYDSTFVDSAESDKYRLARQAAASIYTHAYASARAAYVHAVAVAARYPEGAVRDAAFKTAITARLSADLLNEPIEPSFLMSILCSDAMKIAAAVLLVAGLAALSVGICGLAIASIGVMLATSIGLTSTTTIVAGVVMATASAGLFAGGFFATKQWKNDNDKSAAAVNAMHDVEYEGAPQLS